MLPDRLNSRAVLVGTATYTKGLPQMPHAAANLTDFSTCLAEVLDASSIIPYVDPTSALLILDRLSALADLRLDLLLFYYVGHGLRDIQDQLCLALPGSVDNGHDARPTSLPGDAVFSILRRSSATHRVVILDCCYSGLALDEVSAADLHLLTATSRTEKARFDENERNTAFTGELLELLSKGVADGPAWLDLDLIYRRLDVVLTADDRPVPQQRAVNLSADLVLGRNFGHGSAHSPEGLYSRARYADKVGRAGRAAQAAELFAGIVADAPETAIYQRAHARWIGEAGQPAEAVAILDELIRSRASGVDLDNARASREYWATQARGRPA